MLILLRVVILNNFKLQMVKVATKYKADEKVKQVASQDLDTLLVNYFLEFEQNSLMVYV